MKIIRDKAICMLFYVECTKLNIANCKKRVEELKGLEICLNVDPKQPALVLPFRILGNPVTHIKYLETYKDAKRKPKEQTFYVSNLFYIFMYI